MRTKRYVIGIDYGTESARGVLIDLSTGESVAYHKHPYRHGVMDRALPNGRTLPPDWALQDADDYIVAATDILSHLARAVLSGGEVLGVGVDFTASTPLPALADGTPLSRLLPGEPHAYVKLWKHHAAQPWAERLNVADRGFLHLYGGKTSCEWLPAKAAQIAHESPRVWARAERFIEAGDWMVSQLVGHEVRSVCQAGYKAHYQNKRYPREVIALAPGLAARLGDPQTIGTAAGVMTDGWIVRTGMPGKPVVAVATVDAHAVVPAVGVAESGVMVGSLGTSACHLLVDPQCYAIPGVAGAVKDGIIPGLWGYECGQAGFGDILGWFVRAFPVGESEQAAFDHYNSQAARVTAGSSGLLALDWWNGCRTPLMNPDLSGLFLGMSLQTQAHELYRALLEALCFGTRRVIETLEEGGLRIRRLVLTSGLAERNPLLMQIMSDVTGRGIQVPEVAEATARGAAIHAAVASGALEGFEEAVAVLGATSGKRYSPNPAKGQLYSRLYRFYRDVSDYFAGSDVMSGLRRIRREAMNSPDG